MHNGNNIANDSYVNIDYIGEGEALLCLTDKMNCCIHPHRAGEWYFPNNDSVKTQGDASSMSMNYFYRNRGIQTVRLNRVQNPPERGRFNCTVPDSTNNTQSIYVNLGKCQTEFK